MKEWIFAGVIFFPSLYFCVKHFLLKFFEHQIEQRHLLDVAVKFVTVVQGVSASLVGLIISSSCPDILKDRHWLTEVYCGFGLTYFYYDLWAMFQVYKKDFPENNNISTLENILSYIKYQPLMILHHGILPLIYFPVIMYFRRGLGDYFIGILFLMETAIPFIALHKLLVRFQKQGSFIFALNGTLLVITFGVSRVLVFPFLYWKYAVFKGIALFSVPSKIPLVCNLGSLIIFIVQGYWFFLICLKCRKALLTYIRNSKQS